MADEDDKFGQEANKRLSSDENKDGVIDGSPESIKKMGENLGDMIGGFFSGIVDGFSRYKPTEANKPEPAVEEKASNTEPQVLNENKNES